MQLTKTFRFEASHRLPFHKGKCSRLHGHSWTLEVAVEGPVMDQTGMVVDYADISVVVKPIVDDLDHRHLGTWDGLDITSDWGVEWLDPFLNATSENLLYEIAKRLSLDFPWSSLTLHETCTATAMLTKAEFVRMALQRGE